MTTSPKLDRLARAYDREVLPLFPQRAAELLLDGIGFAPGMNVLEAGCATGHVTAAVLSRLDAASRLLALEPAAALLEVARSKLAAIRSPARLELREAPLHPKLPAGSEAFDLVLSNLALADTPAPRAALAELTRAARALGTVALTLPLKGTWEEPLDLLREVLEQHRKKDLLARLQEYRAGFPDGPELQSWLTEAGLHGVTVSVARTTLLFRSGREFFFAPAIEAGPLRHWKRIAGRGEAMQDIFFFLKEAIDTYFRHDVFPVTVVIGCARGRKMGAAPGARRTPTVMGTRS